MARRGALAQQLNAVESLASVDLLCTDKTGTLTEAALRIAALVPAAGVDEAELARALGALRRERPARNGTLEAIAAAASAPADASRAREPRCRSRRARRWSALELGGETLVLGAPERFDLAGSRRAAAARASAAAASSRSARPRSRCRRRARRPPPPGVRPLGIVVLAERLRPEPRRRSRSSPRRASS